MPRQIFDFEKQEIELTKSEKEAFIKAVKESKSEAEIGIAYDIFIEKLQQEADRRFDNQDRDLWFNLQLVKTFMEAKLWQAALDAVDDAQLVSKYLKYAQEVFVELEEEIKKNL